MRNELVAELEVLAEADDKVMAVLADNGLQVFDRYQEKRPKQFLNVGIAEANLVGMSAGIAASGLIPFAYTILPFITYRAFEFLRNDVCYQNMNVKLIGVGAGWSYSTLGPTHHGTEDIGLVRGLENLVVLSPADPVEAVECLRQAYRHVGPVYIRIGKGKEPIIEMHDSFSPGRLRTAREGSGEIVLFSTGAVLEEVVKAHSLLAPEQQKRTRIVNVCSIHPFDDESFKKTTANARTILTIEEHSIHGGLGGLIAEKLFEFPPAKMPKLRRLGLRHTFAHTYGSVAELRKHAGVSSEQILEAVRQLES